jgi:serine/threonine protein kinase
VIDVGSRIGDYEIVARLKAGGMATLFLARRSGAAGFARHVAIKVVHPHLASDPGFVRMFVEEAKLCAQIVHPNVVHVEELGEAAGTYFLVMEYVHGSALSTLLGALSRLERRFSPELAVWIAMRVADGLEAAHTLTDDRGRLLGVVHRDVSPQNVLVSSTGHIKLIDFGIAKATTSGKRTETGALKGKLRYMSPEQALGDHIDQRADVYSLGIVLWEMLTMHRLFPAGNQFVLLDQVRNPSIEPPSHFVTDIPEALDGVVMSALAKDPAERPASAAEFKRLLSEALPAAKAVDPAQVSEVLAAVLGERIEQRRRELPDSVNLSGTREATPAEDRALHAQDVLKSMTVSAPGVGYEPDGEASIDGPPDGEPRSLVMQPGGTPLTTSIPPRAPAPSRDRMIAMLATAIAILALGVAGGMMLGESRDERGQLTPAAPSIGATARGGATTSDAPVVASPSIPVTGVVVVAADGGVANPALATPVAGGAPAAGVADPGSSQQAAIDREPASDPGSPSRRPAKRRGPRDPDGVRRVVDGVPIYDDDWGSVPATSGR